MAEEIRSTGKQQLVFNILTGTYDYKLAETANEVKSPRSAKSASVKVLSPREEKKSSSSSSSSKKKTKKKSSRHRTREEKVGLLSPRSERELSKKSSASKDKAASDKPEKEAEKKAGLESKKDASVATSSDPNRVGGGVKGAGELVGELLKAEGEQEEAIENAVISYDAKSGTCVRVAGEWRGASAGGCMDSSTWRNNPQIFFTVSTPGEIEISLHTALGGKYVGIGFYVLETRRVLYDDNLLVGKSKFVTGVPIYSYYAVVPTTYLPNIEMAFALNFKSKCDSTITAQLLSPELEWPTPPVIGTWFGPSAGGCGNEETVVNNPQFLLTVPSSTLVRFLLIQPKEEFDSIGLYVVSQCSARITNPAVIQDESKLVVNPDFSDVNEYYVERTLEAGNYVILPCSFDAGQNGDFQIRIMCDRKLEVKPLF